MNLTEQPSETVTAGLKALIPAVVAAVAIQLMAGSAVCAVETADTQATLRTIRGGYHTRYALIAFEFDREVVLGEPVVGEEEISLVLENVTTTLASFRGYKTFDSWVVLEDAGSDLNVRIGLPKDFERFTHFQIDDPPRLVIKLYETPVDSPPLTKIPDEIPTEQLPAGDRPEPSPPPVKVTIRGEQKGNVSTLVFEHKGDVRFGEPVLGRKDVSLLLRNVNSEQAVFRVDEGFGSSIILEDSGRDLNVRISLPEDYVRFGHFQLTDPPRHIINLYGIDKVDLLLPGEETAKADLPAPALGTRPTGVPATEEEIAGSSASAPATADQELSPAEDEPPGAADAVAMPGPETVLPSQTRADTAVAEEPETESPAPPQDDPEPEETAEAVALPVRESAPQTQISSPLAEEPETRALEPTTVEPESPETLEAAPAKEPDAALPSAAARTEPVIEKPEAGIPGPPETGSRPEEPAEVAAVSIPESPQPSEIRKTMPAAEIPEVKALAPREGLLTLNFYQTDIRELLSALAIQRELNIVLSQEVVGNVSVHLYKMTLSQALDAIALAGGFGYTKYGNVYYFYMPAEKPDPEAKRLEMKIFRLKYAEVDKVQEILDAISGMRMIKIHEPSKTLIAEDTPENIDKIETLLSYWDSKPRQVLIEAKILEVTLTDDMTLGVDWQKILGNASIGTVGFSTSALPTGPASPPVSTGTGGSFLGTIITGTGSTSQFTAALNMLKSETDVKTLSTPKILAIHNQPARVQVGGRQGYQVTTTVEGVTRESVEFVETGTILAITPFIDGDGNVLLNVAPSINSAVIEEEVPVVRTTAVSTWLLAKNGETVFMAGLIEDRTTTIRETLPCLGGIPGFGSLFGRTVKTGNKSELVVLITPQVIGTTDPQARRYEERTRRIAEQLRKDDPGSAQQVLDLLRESK